jgi:hypothetical protein
MRLPTRPGLGFELNREALEVFSGTLDPRHCGRQSMTSSV